MKQAVVGGERAWNGTEDLDLARGPRMYRGEVVDAEEGDRLMVKIRPMLLQAQLWKPVLYLIKGLTIAAGGYVSLKQPAPPGIRRLQGGNGGRVSTMMAIVGLSL